MTQTGINLFGLWDWFGGDLVPVLDLCRIADETGVHQVGLAEHVTMGERTDQYPYGHYPVGLDIPWYEPVAMLSAIAGGTKRIRLTTGVMITPLRPVVILAKQFATLHFLSRGRFDIGWGVGWQEAEYTSNNMPYEARFAVLDEQIRACRVIWHEAPASFHGKHIHFDRIHTYPQLPRDATLGMWFGLTEKPKNIQRIAEFGDGWIPMTNDPEQLARAIDQIKEAMVKKGRDPSKLGVRASPTPAFGADGIANFEQTMESVPALLKAGVTQIDITPRFFCKGPEGFADVMKKLASI
jgi:probable F420-dependent oxidoreductase